MKYERGPDTFFKVLVEKSEACQIVAHDIIRRLHLNREELVGMLDDVVNLKAATGAKC